MKREQISIKGWIGIGSLILALLIPFLVGVNTYLLTVLIIMFVYIIYASAWNLLAVSGQGSLGHAAFFGIGGYVSAIVASSLGLPLVATILVGGLFAAVIGLFIGFTCIRLREWFLAMVTFGFAVIAHTITAELSWLTGGWDGIPAKKLIAVTIPNYLLYEYYLMLVLTVAVVGIFYLILKSKMGLALEAIRENELEAKVMGIDVPKYKLTAFAISAYFTGVAGALQIHHFGYITPEIYGIDISFWPIIYCISGGLFTIEGPILGTIFITILDALLKSFGFTYERLILIGLILILVVIFLPRGLVSLPAKIKARLEGRLS
ncbi:MAG TPA: branched-chain amino acid ABC transporter permease [Methanomicrobia archaeon]|nr:branched-chain amino acid ABC transporter permease [Methanomicrobia archaeon]